MSILQTVTTSCKVELLQAIHNFGPTSPNTFKIALYTGNADLSASTTVYTTSNEVANGSGYTTGGNTLVISQSPTSGNNQSAVPTAFISFSNTSWTSASFTARGALIYKAGANGAVCVLDFGNDKTSSNTFTVTMPANTSTSALIRLV